MCRYCNEDAEPEEAYSLEDETVVKVCPRCLLPLE
jgi:hypothetical protein